MSFDIKNVTSLTKCNVDESGYDELGEPLRDCGGALVSGTLSLGCSATSLVGID